tara:strand:- start:180 stop:479 length:300 start_codon:yes stop_codon:yes gene_type:complete
VTGNKGVHIVPAVLRIQRPGQAHRAQNLRTERPAQTTKFGLIAGVANAQETNQNVFLNYQWTPVKNTMMGVEYGYWDTENVDGDSKDANRIMFAAQYNF